MPVVRIPLVGQITQRDATVAVVFAYDQYFRNAHFIVYANPITGKSTVYCGPQEGFSVLNAPAGGVADGTAVKVWTGNSNAILSAFGGTNSTIYTGTTSLGAITGLCGFFSETSISGTATMLAVSESNRAYYYQPAGSLTEITDTDFPPKQTPARTITGNFVHFDGFAGIMCTDGTFWHSDLNSVTGWSSTAYLTAGDQPDPGVAALKYGNYIALLGKQSMEFWANEGNKAGAVLSREKGMTKNIGCPNQYAAVPFQDTFAFVGVQNGYGVFIMTSQGPKRISTDAVERVLTRNAATARLNVIGSWSRARLLLTFDTVSQSGMLYDPDTGIWSTMYGLYIRQTDTTPTGASSVTTVMVGKNGNGSVYQNSDQGVIGTQGCRIQTMAMDFGTKNRKTLRRLTLIGDREVPTNTAVTVKFIDNDYVTESSERTLTITSADPAPSIYRCGSFKKRSFVLEFSSAVSSQLCRLEAMELDIEVHAT